MKSLSCCVCCRVTSPLFFDALHNVVSHVEDAACWRFAHSTPPSTSLLRISFECTLLAEVVLASRHYWVLRGGTYTVSPRCMAIEAENLHTGATLNNSAHMPWLQKKVCTPGSPPSVAGR